MSNVEFSSGLLTLFLVLVEGWISPTSEDGSRLGDILFMLASPTTEHVGVDAKVGGGFANAFGLGEFERPKPVRCCFKDQEWLRVCIRRCRVCVFPLLPLL